MHEIFGEPISAYTRAQGVADGVLVDVSTMAKEAGIRFPVAMTAEVYASCVAVPKGLEGSQDVAGRLWDVVYLLSVACRRAKGERIKYRVRVRQTARSLETVELHSVCGPGDNAEPVITIMLPDQS